MISKVIFFRYLPLTRKVYEDFYLEELNLAGFNIEYWYLPFIIKVPDEIEEYRHSCVRVLNNYTELNKALKGEIIGSTLFISIQTYYWDTLRLFWLMTKNHCLLAVFGKNTVPQFSFSSVYSKLEYYSLSQIIDSVKNRIAKFLKRIGVIKPYDIIFIAGKNGIHGLGSVSKFELEQAQHVLINSDDYDRTLQKKIGPKTLSEKYIVFIDECIPFHPDVQICGINKVIDPNVYYNDINLFFERIESDTGLPVVIAAHPKSLIYHKKNYFNGRKVIFGKTDELIRDSELVLAHDSTAISYVVGFCKPLLSMTSRELEVQQPDVHRYVMAFSEFLNSPLVYIDDFCKKNRHLSLANIQINMKNYEKYKYEFLTNPETQKTLSSSLVIEGIKNFI